MAGNKLSSKSKSKDDKAKGGKGSSQTEDAEDLDFALLRKPIHTSVTGFAQAKKVFELGTEELKDLILKECDLLYECKVCRNIFRSLLNFISHKRVYCKEKFSSSTHGHFVKNLSVATEYFKIKKLEEAYQESLKVNKEIVENDEPDNRIPLSKDLTAVVENITKIKGVTENKVEDIQQVNLQEIPSSTVAVFQSSVNEKQDCMKTQVAELDHMLSQDNAVLQRDGKFKVATAKDLQEMSSDNVIQISDDDDSEDSKVLMCKICNLQFSTQKTLKFHVKHKHLESRLVYPCPDCVDIFSTSWSVYRHLFKVHRKTAAQIRRLRESIQAKAFKMNNPPASYEKRKNNMKPTDKKITEEERIDQENQEWMDNLESSQPSPRCGGCGRTFERRAALAAHAVTCVSRSRLTKGRIQIHVRRDYMKLGAKATTDDSQTQPIIPKEEPKTDSPCLEEATMFICEESSNSSQKSVPNEEGTASKNNSNLNRKSLASLYSGKLQHNITILKNTILARNDGDISRYLCKICNVTLKKTQELYDHMADHYSWFRYACKLCNHKNYTYDNIIDHVRDVHKLKGDTDFYYSTVKALNGDEALELSDVRECIDVEIISESRRQSSDSSRVSDDSTNSNKPVGSRKRKMRPGNQAPKKKKDDDNDDIEDQKSNDSVSNKDVGADSQNYNNLKPFEENSSDLDDLEEKLVKRMSVDENTSVASRRPVRKRTKPKNEDFEYDLSNLLKMEAQGYRDSQIVAAPKVNPTKKKSLPDSPTNTPEIYIKDFIGALMVMSKKSVEVSAALIKPLNLNAFTSQKDQRITHPFAKPWLPKTQNKQDKVSPKKDDNEENENNGTKTPQKISNNTEIPESNEEVTKNVTDKTETKTNETSPGNEKVSDKEFTMVPLKFQRQSLELIKNPIINKNLTEFSKAGMKTKILVIKPINRNKDGAHLTKPLKFQTIKLKDPSKTTVEKKSDQVMVVKMPNVDSSVISMKEHIVPQNDSNTVSQSNVTEENSAIVSDSQNIVDSNISSITDDQNDVSNTVVGSNDTICSEVTS